jgi:hypothetical protein
MQQRLLLAAGALALLVLIFGTPAVLVPMVMNDVPDRSMTKVLTTHQEAVNIVERTYARHRDPDHSGRLAPLPKDSRGWIELVNPMGRKAPGGGLAILPVADGKTGAVGLAGDQHRVVISVPEYRDLKSHHTTLVASP